MIRPLSALLPVVATLLLSACSRSNWTADATEWVIGLAVDNICELAEPLCADEAAADAPYPAAAKNSRHLVPATAGQQATAAALLSPGTRAELLRVVLERRDEQYTVYAELSLPQENQPIWVRVARGKQPSEFSCLRDPATAKPLRLDLDAAVAFTTKEPLR